MLDACPSLTGLPSLHLVSQKSYRGAIPNSSFNTTARGSVNPAALSLKCPPKWLLFVVCWASSARTPPAQPHTTMERTFGTPVWALSCLASCHSCPLTCPAEWSPSHLPLVLFATQSALWPEFGPSNREQCAWVWYLTAALFPVPPSSPTSYSTRVVCLLHYSSLKTPSNHPVP